MVIFLATKPEKEALISKTANKNANRYLFLEIRPVIFYSKTHQTRIGQLPVIC